MSEISNRLRAQALLVLSSELGLASAQPAHSAQSKEMKLASARLALEAMAILVLELLDEGSDGHRLSYDEEEHVITTWNHLAETWNSCMKQ